MLGFSITVHKIFNFIFDEIPMTTKYFSAIMVESIENPQYQRGNISFLVAKPSKELNL